MTAVPALDLDHEAPLLVGLPRARHEPEDEVARVGVGVGDRHRRPLLRQRVLALLPRALHVALPRVAQGHRAVGQGRGGRGRHAGHPARAVSPASTRFRAGSSRCQVRPSSSETQQRAVHEPVRRRVQAVARDEGRPEPAVRLDEPRSGLQLRTNASPVLASVTTVLPAGVTVSDVTPLERDEVPARNSEPSRLLTQHPGQRDPAVGLVAQADRARPRRRDPPARRCSRRSRGCARRRIVTQTWPYPSSST